MRVSLTVRVCIFIHAEALTGYLVVTRRTLQHSAFCTIPTSENCVPPFKLWGDMRQQIQVAQV